MRRFLWLVLACVVWAAPARAQDAADRAWDAGEVEAAAPLYEARLAADPADATALHRLALVRAWNARYDESLALFDRLLRVDPDNRDARVDRARVLAWRGDPAAAARELEPLLAADPGFLPALEARAQFESWAGDYDRALETYGRIQQITPDDRGVGLNRARVLSWASRHDAALAAYDSLLRQDASDTEALVGLATVLGWTSRLDSAEAVYRRVLVMEPGNAEARRGLARTAGWRGRLVLAERRWREAIAADSADAAAWTGLSQTLGWQGREAAALAAGRRAVALAPTDREARRALRVAREAVAPRATSSYVREWDSDGNDIGSVSAGGAARPFGPAAEVRLDVYRRGARADGVGERTSAGGTATLRTQLGVGWSLSASAGASAPDAGDDVIPIYRAAIGSPRRYPVTAGVSYAHEALDATALLIERAVYVDEWSADLGWNAAAGWTVSAGVGTAAFAGGDSGERNRRVSGSFGVARRVSGPVTLGVGLRTFGFRRDLTDGYFDPDFYGLAEVTARWLRDWRRWSVHAEVAPGLQQVRSDGEPAASLRGTGSVAYALSPGRRIVLTGLFANAGVGQLSPEAESGDYRYRAVSLAGSWAF